MPAHVTLLFPFVPANELDDATDLTLRALFRATAPFGVRFTEARRFAATLYLAPEPAEPFARLTHDIVRRFPEHPPYGGRFADVIPHLTVADHADQATLDAAEAAVGSGLPLDAVASEAWLMIERDEGWETHTRYPFGS
jgi:2'-5' RNA ligase